MALNPVIKFTTLFGLLAVELAVQLTARCRAAGRRTSAGGGLLRAFDGLRLPVVLRDADPDGRVAGAGAGPGTRLRTDEIHFTTFVTTQRCRGWCQ